MVFFVDSFRETVTSVIGASRHLAWYMSWQTGGTDGVRERPRPEAPEAAPPRQASAAF
jgi:hypothetical protein